MLAGIAKAKLRHVPTPFLDEPKDPKLLCQNESEDEDILPQGSHAPLLT